MCRTPFSFDTCAMASDSAELTLPSRKSTLSPSISLRAFCTAVPASPLDESSTRSSTCTTEDAALGVDLVERHLAADKLVLARAGVGAGQWIVEADLDRVSGAGADNERTGELRGGKRRPRFDESAAAHAGAPIGLRQASLPCSDDLFGLAHARQPDDPRLLIVPHCGLLRLRPSSRADDPAQHRRGSLGNITAPRDRRA